MELNDATRVVSVIDQRIQKLTRSEAQVETTWGEVVGISADGMFASAYLYGDTDVSEGFRIPGTLALSVGDKVKVAWDARGDRWVVESAASGDYKKVAINPSTGQLLMGDGTAPPTEFSGIPSGVIVMWSGSSDNIPEGWFLCNGDNGTPDLRDRFIVGGS